MYGKTYKLHNSPGLVPAEALFVQSPPAFDGFHNDIKIFSLACSEVIEEIGTAQQTRMQYSLLQVLFKIVRFCRQLHGNLACIYRHARMTSVCMFTPARM